jgi:threonine/homoserine/homoserine lactone efflux protein
MNPLQFAGEVILVSASGVLSPGPLFFIIIYGSKQGVTGGIKIAFGHTIVEFLLVITLALGLFTFSQVFVNNENLKIISIIGGIAIIVFALIQIISITKLKVNGQNAYVGISAKKGPILLGVIFSALTPGGSLMVKSIFLAFNATQIPLFYDVSHHRIFRILV